MRIGFIGDIVGRPGRKIIKENLTKIKNEYGIDFVIANGENIENDINYIINTFRNAKDYGSILKINKVNYTFFK